MFGILAASPLGAQAAADSVPHGWFGGFSFGVPAYQGTPFPEAFVLGANFTHVQAGHLGFDFAVGTAPRVVQSGVVPIGIRAGVAFPIDLAPTFLLVPSAGASFVGLVSESASGAFGANAGIAAIGIPSNSFGVRAALSYHRFRETTDGFWLIELGLVSVPLPHPFRDDSNR